MIVVSSLVTSSLSVPFSRTLTFSSVVPSSSAFTSVSVNSADAGAICAFSSTICLLMVMSDISSVMTILPSWVASTLPLVSPLVLSVTSLPSLISKVKVEMTV